MGDELESWLPARNRRKTAHGTVSLVLIYIMYSVLVMSLSPGCLPGTEGRLHMELYIYMCSVLVMSLSPGCPQGTEGRQHMELSALFWLTELLT